MDSNKILIVSFLVLALIIILYFVSNSDNKEKGEEENGPTPHCVKENIYVYNPSASADIVCDDCILTNNEISYDVAFTGLTGFRTIGIQSTGKIIVGGNTSFFRFNTDGTIDATFGVAGVASMPVYTHNQIFRSKIGSDDLIYSTGRGFEVNVIRFTADGILDTSFAGTGRFQGGPNDFSDSGGVIDLYIYADNSVLASRVVNHTVYKITSAGVYDPSFTDIVYNIPTYTMRRISNVLAYQDKIYLFGFIRDDNFLESPFIGRANFDGTIDVSFGTNGYLIILPSDLGIPYFYTETYGGCTIDYSNGDLYWVGSMDIYDEGDYFISVIKMDKDGVIDINYGNGGVAINERLDLSLPFQYSEAYGNSHILPCDKSLIVSAINYNDSDLSYLWRLSPDGSTISENFTDALADDVIYIECVPDGNGNIFVTGNQSTLPLIRSFSCQQVDYRAQDNAV